MVKTTPAIFIGDLLFLSVSCIGDIGGKSELDTEDKKGSIGVAGDLVRAFS